MKILNAYISRLHRAAAVDPVVGETFLKVANFLAPPQSLLGHAVAGLAWPADHPSRQWRTAATSRHLMPAVSA